MFFDSIYYILFFFFFSSPNFKRGGALAPSMDAPPLVMKFKLIWILISFQASILAYPFPKSLH